MFLPLEPTAASVSLGSGPSFAAVIRKVCYADEVDFDAINGNGRWSRFEVVMKAERAERILS